MIPNRKQDIKGAVRGVREGNRQGHSGASSEDPYDTNVWGSLEEWDKAVNHVTRNRQPGSVVDNAKAHIASKRKRPKPSAGWISPAQFGSIPVSDSGGDITTTGQGDSACV